MAVISWKDVKLNSCPEWTDEICPVFMMLGQRNDSQCTALVFAGLESALEV